MIMILMTHIWHNSCIYISIIELKGVSVRYGDKIKRDPSVIYGGTF